MKADIAHVDSVQTKLTRPQKLHRLVEALVDGTTNKARCYR